MQIFGDVGLPYSCIVSYSKTDRDGVIQVVEFVLCVVFCLYYVDWRFGHCTSCVSCKQDTASSSPSCNISLYLSVSMLIR
jgi:hypothetical protein